MNVGDLAEYLAELLQASVYHDTTGFMTGWEVVGLDIGEIVITTPHGNYRLDVHEEAIPADTQSREGEKP